ncbi:hypothetical protein SSX86_031633 [Deinandra increscens subsp. villosa]|uniref:Chalcone synthase n=1 Tax=Deinandra increscens subsp. villosa TaxID=3103831 RepID=A0AAP0C655_9ASTR
MATLQRIKLLATQCVVAGSPSTRPVLHLRHRITLRMLLTGIDVGMIRKAERAEGPASILAIGTATPSNCVYQADYPDYYFRITKSEHMVDLKEKFQRMCDKSLIRKRYMHITEEFLKENPNMCEYMAPSLDVRQDVGVVEVPKLGKEAAVKAIEEWGYPKSKITHLIFCTTWGIHAPGADYELTKLLGLRPSVKRFMMYQQGCFAGGTVLRLAKDLAENNKGARILIVCSEITTVTFRGPNESHLDSLVGQALFGDGAAAVIVGSDPDLSVERPLFEMVSAAQTILPDSEGTIEGHVREVGFTFHILKDVPGLISKNIENALMQAFSPLGINDWNSIFWIAHPGGPAILDQVELRLGLKEHKMRATRHVLSEYGNMSSACVLFILDEMRRKSIEEGKATTGEGLDCGVLFGFGPGLTVETVVLRGLPTIMPTAIQPRLIYPTHIFKSIMVDVALHFDHKVNEPISVPVELDALLGKKFAFFIDITSYNFKRNCPIYGFAKLTANVETISELENRLGLLEGVGSSNVGNSTPVSTVEGSIKPTLNAKDKMPMVEPSRHNLKRSISNVYDIAEASCVPYEEPTLVTKGQHHRGSSRHDANLKLALLKLIYTFENQTLLLQFVTFLCG